MTPLGCSGDLFDAPGATTPLAPQALLLHGFALDLEADLGEWIGAIAARSPFRHMQTPGGQRMSVAMTSCGAAGWISDARGYRYEALDPCRGEPWPPLPELFSALARRAATTAGFAGFDPDACLINRYQSGARMSLHQDRDERDLAQPIVSVSLGLTATFLFGGARRSDRPVRVPLRSGDVVVWGGVSRLAHHGVGPVAAGAHPRFGQYRFNLTFRRAR